jgi:hypothetical protein
MIFGLTILEEILVGKYISIINNLINILNNLSSTPYQTDNWTPLSDLWIEHIDIKSFQAQNVSKHI